METLRVAVTAVIVGALLAGCTSASSEGTAPTTTARAGFDLQAHRGGIGLTTEEQPAGFAKALELGVTTLELDTHVTRDGKVVVNHDRRIQPVKCRDTGAATPGDPAYPYVGKLIKDLTLAQIKTLDCGYRQLPGFPQQQVVAEARMAELSDVFDVVRKHGATGIMMNIETKVEAGQPDETAPRDVFVQTVHDEIARSGLAQQVTIQSFDWAALALMHRLEPTWRLVALSTPDLLQVGQPGASPWLGGLDIDDVGGDVARAAASVAGVTTLSPAAESVDRAMVDQAHRLGLRVVPWTVDDMGLAARLMDSGVDGIITNYPDQVRQLMQQRGMPLPPARPSVG
ncbi:MAG: glycerophosphodiester phosphodiesterase family protein [Lapillicoccus sp.]